MKSVPRKLLALLAGLLLVVFVGVALARGSEMLRQNEAFRVREVAVEGLVYMNGDEVVHYSGLDTTSSIFDEEAVLEESTLTHPLVKSVTISRRLPSGLRMEVSERWPVAFIRGDSTLRATDDEGVLLPISPVLHSLDLPIVFLGEDVEGSRVTRHADREALQALGRLRIHAPQLFERVVAGVSVDGGMELEVRGLAYELIIGPEIDETFMPRLTAVLDFLESAPSSRRGHAVQTIDLRFLDQAVIR